MRFTAATVKRYLPLGSRTTFALAAAAAVNPVRRTTRPVVLSAADHLGGGHRAAAAGPSAPAENLREVRPGETWLCRAASPIRFPGAVRAVRAWAAGAGPARRASARAAAGAVQRPRMRTCS